MNETHETRSRARAVAVAASSARPVVLMLLGAALAVTSLVAQDVPAELTLRQAIRLARDNNPTYQSTRNDQAAADWQVREAYGSFLPSVTANGSLAYQEPGVQNFGTVDLGSQSTDWYSSGYSLRLNWGVDGNTLFGVSNARAGQRATAANIDATEFTLESSVTLQYMSALRAKEAVDVAQRQLDRAAQNLEIVQNRVESGAAAGTEGKQAEIDLGRAEVALIQAQQNLRNQKLRLMEQIGLNMDEDVELVSQFEIFEPTWTHGELVSYALEAHPSLLAFEARESASTAQVRQARSQYFPSVNLSTAFTGFTNQALNKGFLIDQAEKGARASFENCQLFTAIQNGLGTALPGFDPSQGCGSPNLSESQREAVLERNDVFPFDFTTSPLRMTLSVSVPVFQGFSRQRQVEQAEAAARDAEHNLRAEELRLRRAVTEAHNALISAHRVVQIEERNRELAEERLEAARQRYRIGAAPSAAAGGGNSTFLELLDAQTSMTTADRDYLNAVYDFHQALAQLEAATGRSLRPVEPGEAQQAQEG